VTEHRTFYGDPGWTVEELLETNAVPPPEDGDELCDGHQAHYIWQDGRWT
jgi:hypothetical protein